MAEEKEEMGHSILTDQCFTLSPKKINSPPKTSAYNPISQTTARAPEAGLAINNSPIRTDRKPAMPSTPLTVDLLAQLYRRGNLDDAG